MKRTSFIKSLLAVFVLFASFAGGVANALCTQQGCVMAGPRLASIDSTKGELLNVLLGNLTGSSVSVNAVDWNTLATGDINVASMLNALQAQVGASTPYNSLQANATLAQILTAASTAALGQGNAGLSTALNTVKVPLTVPVSTIKLGDLLTIANAAGDTSINALDLVTGAAQLYNQKNVATTPTPIALNVGSIAGLTGVTSVSLAAQVVEPPVYTCGIQGAQFHTAGIRIKLNIVIPTPPAITGSTLDAILLVSESNIQLLNNFSLYIEVARAEGTIGMINALTKAFDVDAIPGVVDLYLGSIPDATFFNRTRSLQYSDFTPINIGSLTLKTTIAFIVTNVSGTIKMRATARAQAPSSPTTLHFSQPYPQTQTVSTGGASIGALVTSLLSNLEITVTLNVLPIVNLDLTVAGLLKPIVGGVLSPVLTTVLNSTVNPLLDLLGVRIGQAVVTAYGVYTLCSVSGWAYSDANHNGTRELGEAGTGLTLYAKLVNATSPSTVAQYATVDTSTGAYSFTNVVGANYSLLIDNNTTTSDVTATTPALWVPTDPRTQSRSIAVTVFDLPNQNFGLFNGSMLSGRVFQDTGVGSGTANNAVRDGTELTLPGATVAATNAAASTTYDTTVSATDGLYTLWIPASAGATSVKITETNPASYTSVGAAVGTTSGTYDRTTDTVTFTNSVGATYANVNFADVPSNQFDTDGRQTVLPGNVAFYPHSFTAGTAGTLTLTTTPAAALTGWTNLAYRDANCNGVIDSGEVAISAPIAVVAAQKVCVVVRVFAADTAAFNEQYSLTVSASFAYVNTAFTDALDRKDLTTVSNENDAGLRLTKTVDKASAKTGDVLTYTITYLNNSATNMKTLKLYDSTPAYTVFTAAACGTPPTGLGACSLTKQPTVGTTGAVEWTFAGELTPGATGAVTFQVTLQ